jgi:hypothetical protein
MLQQKDMRLIICVSVGDEIMKAVATKKPYGRGIGSIKANGSDAAFGRGRGRRGDYDKA